MNTCLRRSHTNFVSVTLLAIALALASPAGASVDSGLPATALDRYVASQAPAYSHSVEKEPVDEDLFSVTTLKLYSQQWQGWTWSHNVTVYTPSFCRRSGPVTIIVDGGANPSKDLRDLSAVAIATQTPVAILGSVPNQPLYGLREDALIAYTFARYMETGDETWPLLLPMTQSVVACMDALDSHFASQGKFSVSGYAIAGASKRGWTTWLAAAVDSRVIGVIPLVYDNLNLAAQMENHLAVWGEYSPQIHDYTDLGIPQHLSTSAETRLAEMVDPYCYLDRIQMPKLIVIGSNDPYWPLGSINLYFDQLHGDSYVLIMPNAGHSAGDVDRLLAGVIAFLGHISGHLELPELGWHFCVDEDKGVARATINTPEDATVQLWQASSDSTDFRRSAWALAGEPSPGPVAEFELALPETGMRAVFADINVRLLDSTVTLTTTPFIY